MPLRPTGRSPESSHSIMSEKDQFFKSTARPAKIDDYGDRDIEADADGGSSTDMSIPSAGELERTIVSTLGYDLQLSTVVIAVMSVFRLALKGVVETCVSQGAWIWVSGFRKGRTEARLEDFKMFDEASRGLYGSLVLIWRLKASHLACAGAAITILIQGFETFSSQMLQTNEQPTIFINASSMNASPAPPPLRAEAWHNVVPRGFSNDMSLGLSTKAAIYDSIIAGSMSDLPVSCSTANCTWPIFPTLAICGSCTESDYSPHCGSQDDCSYSMPSGTSISSIGAGPSEYHFTVARSNGSSDYFNETSRAVFSVFDMIYNVTVTNGIIESSMIANWSKTEFAPESSAHFDEYTFIDIPPELHVNNQTRYSISSESIGALKSFMDTIMWGNASEIAGVVDYSSDWVQAMQNATSDLAGWMSRLSLSMTNDVRVSGTLDTTKILDYSGTAYMMASHVDVNWYWVVYPMLLMVLAFCYLAQTVWRTARDQVCAWKGDSLPMLFCHVSKSIHAQVRNGMDVPEGLNDRVGRTEVELVRKEDGQWLFREPRNH
ncbi:hypothetical protein F5X99DRAFT_426539 [Biscogniauxia marginata]|nr:hypothetical protein F5X99DRAFT_426539 [Biscogniauxia marginata]